MRHEKLLGQTTFFKAKKKVMTEGFLKPNAKTAFSKLFSSSVPPINYLKTVLVEMYLAWFPSRDLASKELLCVSNIYAAAACSNVFSFIFSRQLLFFSVQPEIRELHP